MQHPVFLKYRRTWLSEATGYSRGYLCRVATGKIPLTQYFIERVAYSLRQHPTDLFLPKVLKNSDWRRHQEKKRAKEGKSRKAAMPRRRVIEPNLI